MKYKAIRNLWLREENKYIVRGQDFEVDRDISERFAIPVVYVEEIIEDKVSPVVKKKPRRKKAK